MIIDVALYDECMMQVVKVCLSSENLRKYLWKTFGLILDQSNKPICSVFLHSWFIRGYICRNVYLLCYTSNAKKVKASLS